jgi:hypothetical protein
VLIRHDTEIQETSSQPPYMRDAETSIERKTFEFVTITGPLVRLGQKGVSKTVRTHIMRDYIRKQTVQVMTGSQETARGINLEEPSRYKGRFRLDSSASKRKSRERKKYSHAMTADGEFDFENGSGSLNTVVDEPPQSLVLFRKYSPRPVYNLTSNSIDPFHSLSIKLEPQSQMLLSYCKLHYHCSF